MPESKGPATEPARQYSVRDGNRSRLLIALLSVLLLFGIFALDLVTPLGVVVYALFAVVVLLGVLARMPSLVVINAMVASLLIVTGTFLSHSNGESLEQAAINRGVVLVAVWATVMLSMLIDRSRRALEARDAMLERMAGEDPLTGVANRRRFDQELYAECQRAMREENWVSLVMIDIDHFKEYNDHLGHPQGDVCLSKIAETIQAQLHRPADLVARYGGEEFSVLLPATGLDGAQARAERIRQNVEDLAIPHPTRGVVTISLGVATMRPAGSPDCPTQLLDAADRALYRAKDSGRNRVVVDKVQAA